MIKEKFTELGLKPSISMKGYCATLTIMLLMDILCTKEQVYKPGHFERLLNDLQKRKPDQEIEERHKFASALFGKHLAYIVLQKCILYYKGINKKPLWWNLCESELGKWDSLNEIETINIKRIVRLKVAKYKNLTHGVETEF